MVSALVPGDDPPRTVSCRGLTGAGRARAHGGTARGRQQTAEALAVPRRGSMDPTPGCWQYRCEGNRNVVVANPAKRVIRRILKFVPTKVAQEAQCGRGTLSKQTVEREAEAPTTTAADGDYQAVIACSRDHRSTATEAAAAAAEPVAAAGSAAAGVQATEMTTACPAASTVEDLAEEVYAIARYYANVMKPLLLGYAIVPVPVTLDSQFIDRVLKNCSSLRPVERQHNPVGRTRVCLELPDLCYLPCSVSSQSDQSPTFAVEVKIKCGTYVLRTADGRSSCMPCALFQHRKLSGIVGGCRAADRPYCPLDLFSGNRDRMAFALRTSLLDCRFSTNRMRIFKNGSYLRFDGQEKWSPERYVAAVDAELAPFFGSAEAGVTRCDSLLQLVAEAMLAAPRGCQTAESPVADSIDSPPSHRESAVTSDFVDISTVHVTERCCFSSFSFGETTLNGHDRRRETCADGAAAVGSHHRCDENGLIGSHLPSGCLLDRLRTVQMLSGEVEVEEIYRDCFMPLASYLKERPALAKRLFCFEPPYWDVAAGKTQLEVTDCEPAMADRFVKVRNFLVAKTASDCSAMITLRPALPADERVTVTGTEMGEQGTDQEDHRRSTILLRDAVGTVYLCSVRVIDLDPKPMLKMPIYMEAYKRCVSALSTDLRVAK